MVVVQIIIFKLTKEEQCNRISIMTCWSPQQQGSYLILVFPSSNTEPSIVLKTFCGSNGCLLNGLHSSLKIQMVWSYFLFFCLFLNFARSSSELPPWLWDTWQYNVVVKGASCRVRLPGFTPFCVHLGRLLSLFY